jgi:hypothetical protein
MNTYIYIYTHIYTYMHIHTHIHIYIPPIRYRVIQARGHCGYLASHYVFVGYSPLEVRPHDPILQEIIIIYAITLNMLCGYKNKLIHIYTYIYIYMYIHA